MFIGKEQARRKHVGGQPPPLIFHVFTSSHIVLTAFSTAMAITSHAEASSPLAELFSAILHSFQ